MCARKRLRPTPYPLPPTPFRPGITLLEVLISMFVLMIGLVAVAALMPIGRFEAASGMKLDRATVVGRQALRDARGRGMLDPALWAPAVTVPPQTPVSGPAPFVIDPLAVASSPGPNFGNAFPAGASTTISRISLLISPTTPAVTYSYSLADSIFRSQDDLVFNLQRNPDDPPQQQYSGVPGTPWRRASTGDYSWLLTVVPQPGLNSLSWYDATYVVSAVVFYKRNLGDAASSELTCGVTFPAGSTGLGGGDVQLQSNLPVKAGQWLMLYDGGNLLNWYRIVASDVPAQGATTRTVTLAGADWNVKRTATAWWLDGVVAVYAKPMTLEKPSVWSIKAKFVP